MYGPETLFLGPQADSWPCIYAYDVDTKTDAFTNRRVFAYIDTGAPDGIQLDAAGNVYAGCGDGAQVRVDHAPHTYVHPSSESNLNRYRISICRSGIRRGR